MAEFADLSFACPPVDNNVVAKTLGMNISRRGAIREFQFHECTDLRSRVKLAWRRWTRRAQSLYCASSLAKRRNKAIAPYGLSGDSELRVDVYMNKTHIGLRTMKVGEAIIPLTPGMTVTVEIKTESRRVIDYLFSPLAKVASEALREK